MENLKNLIKGDKALWMIYFLLTLVSTVEVFSAMSTLSFKTGDIGRPFLEHMMHLGLGFVVLLFFHWLPTHLMRYAPLVVLPLCWLFLFIAPFFGHAVNGAVRWLVVTEAAKISTIITVAIILSRTQEEKSAHPQAMKYVLIIVGISSLLILPQNLSSAALLFLTVYGMMIAGRIPIPQLAKLTVILTLIGSASLYTCSKMPDEVLSSLDNKPLIGRVSTWVRRMKDFTAPDDDTEISIYGKKAQRIYADLAIQEGGIFGKGPGNSTYRDFLPQAYSDFIFAIIIEETGIIGGLVILGLYVIFMFRCYRIAFQAPSLFQTFLVAGLSIMIVLQALVNIAVAVDFIPITGQTLPFISRGGWSIVSSCVCMGIILGVSRSKSQTSDSLQFWVNGSGQ